jgi:hypothetical protein
MALVVVGDFDVVGVATVPAETKAVLVVDPDGMLAGAVVFDGVEFVVRWDELELPCDLTEQHIWRKLLQDGLDGFVGADEQTMGAMLGVSKRATGGWRTAGWRSSWR